MRGTQDQIAASEWLVRELDKPADAPRANTSVFKMTDTGNHGETDIRVFYLPYAATVQQFQEAATLIRTVEEIRRVFTINASKAMVVRATPEQVAAADWIVQELGTPVTADRLASAPYPMPATDREGEEILRVFYVKNLSSVPLFQQQVTQIRSATKMRRVFTYNASMAMAVRGTAEQMLKDRQVAAK